MTASVYFEISGEIDRHFDDSSIDESGSPTAVILMGGVATGKTTMRKDKYSHGYVLIDAAEIFHSISGDQVLPFPDALREPLGVLGRLITRQALSERRNIVTEIIGAESEPFEKLLKHLKALGYEVKLVLVDCDFEECIRRNEKRGDNISAYYAEPIHRKWIVDSCLELTQVRDRLESNLKDNSSPQ